MNSLGDSIRIPETCFPKPLLTSGQMSLASKAAGFNAIFADHYFSLFSSPVAVL